MVKQQVNNVLRYLQKAHTIPKEEVMEGSVMLFVALSY